MRRKKDVIHRRCEYLEGQLKQLRYYAAECEYKLKELMGEKPYAEWSIQMARRMFRAELEGMAESDFKNFALDNFDCITQMGAPGDDT